MRNCFNDNLACCFSTLKLWSAIHFLQTFLKPLMNFGMNLHNNIWYFLEKSYLGLLLHLKPKISYASKPSMTVMHRLSYGYGRWVYQRFPMQLSNCASCQRCAPELCVALFWVISRIGAALYSCTEWACLAYEAHKWWFPSLAFSLQICRICSTFC